ncbi:hydroxypyruvate isomerase family protein [Aureibaculum luteum]|uniref:hydroxypyruvate isomerase family protein n=1 Tax=Aureibaculum luteum TaxID=1548456 RepID=UPI000E47EBC6|nr:TIM barrel protein [Aureibaculum luteum]
MNLPSVKIGNQLLKGNINHSVCRWCYEDIPLDLFAQKIKTMGIKAIDLLKPCEWKIVQKYGLVCSLATDTFTDICNGFNDIKNHSCLQKKYSELIYKAAHAGIKKVIVFPGNRNGVSDSIGFENCAQGLDVIIKQAEKENITLVMELLNSKIDHPDYQCDYSSWGIELVDRIGAPNFKLLYDIYHMQIMEGNIIATIQKYHTYFAHYHTGGVPGRNEINNSQELNYPAIMKAIVKTRYDGFVAQEFIPTYTNKLNALKEAISICDI